MKLKHLFAFISFLTVSLIYCQDKQITLEDIWGGSFRTEVMQALHSMNNGKQYSVLNSDSQTATIDIYDYKTLEKEKTLVSSADIAEIQGFFDYSFSDDNVHLQNTMRMVEALIQADKQFEWMIYPGKNHSIYGGNTRLHL